LKYTCKQWIKTLLKVSGGCAAAFFLAWSAPAEGADEFRIESMEEPYIGVEVMLSLSGKEVDVPGATYEWSFDGNVKPILLRRGGLECRFTPFDTNPIFASVNALDAAGNFLASADFSLTAKEFTVNILMIEPEPFMLWDADAKQDAAADGLIAGEPVQFGLELIPAYTNEVKCQWNTDAATAIRSGESAPQVTIIRNDIGDAEISVVVANTNGVVLGRGKKNVNVPIPRTRVDESIRRKNAWNHWIEALSQWDAKNFDEAMENAVSAAELDPETMEIAEGLKTMSGNYIRVERARKLVADAGILQGEQKLVEALKVYRRAYAAWTLTETETVIKSLESEIDKIRLQRQQAEWLRDTAAAYDQEGLFEDALKYYKETLALQPDEAVTQRADRIEKRLASIAQANALADEGRKLETEGQLLAAVEKYKESLKFEADTTLEVHTGELEETIKERRSRAAVLRREAADLQKKNNDAEALLRYKESQALWAEPDLENRIAELEKIVTEVPPQAVRSPEDFGIGTQADAARLLQEGHALYKQGNYREALEVYRKSYAVSKDQRLADWISRVETSLKEYEAVLQANVLIKEANNLYNEGNYPGALVKYKESLAVHANPEVENFTQLLEKNIKSDDAVGSEELASAR
jgi:tetratricopeptide (TPR) repeat protein